MPTSSSLSPWIALVGVMVGFILGEGSRYARYRWDICRNKKIIMTELQTILSQLPQKRDVLRQAIGHLKQQSFMPTLSVRAVSTGYHSVLDDLYPHLSLVERNCLHVIYERLRIADEQMDGLEESFIKAVKDKIMDNPWLAYAGQLEELLASFDVIERLARAYIAKEPIDVFAQDDRK